MMWKYWGESLGNFSDLGITEEFSSCFYNIEQVCFRVLAARYNQWKSARGSGVQLTNRFNLVHDGSSGSSVGSEPYRV